MRGWRAVLLLLLVPYAILALDPWQGITTTTGGGRWLDVAKDVFEFVGPGAAAVIAYHVAHRHGFWMGYAAGLVGSALSYGIDQALNAISGALGFVTVEISFGPAFTVSTVFLLAALAACAPGLGAWLGRRDRRRVVVHEVLAEEGIVDFAPVE